MIPPKPHLASPNGGLPSSVLWAQLMLKDRLRPGDIAVDATMGNGHDTLFLTQCVSPGGHVFAFDVQATALVETAKRVPAEMTTLIHSGHETMRDHVPAEQHGKISAIMFNLGYLPGTDKTLITHTETTMIAVQAALELLRPGGLLTIAVWAAGLESRRYEVQHMRPINRAASPPELWVVWKRG